MTQFYLAHLAFSVAKNCYNAAFVQRAFVEANERFKNTVTRYSGRAGSALAGAKSTRGGSFIREVREFPAWPCHSSSCNDIVFLQVFGLNVDGSEAVLRPSGNDSDSSGGTDGAGGRASVSYGKNVKTARGRNAGKEDSNETTADLSTASADSTDAHRAGDVVSKANQDAEYRRALNDMLLLRLFNESSTVQQPKLQLPPPTDMRQIYSTTTPPLPADDGI